MTDVLQSWLVEHQWLPFGWALFVLAFAVTQVLFIPRSAVSLASGAMFGLAVLPLVVAGTTLGAVTAFLLARYAISRPVQRMIARRTRLQRILAAVDAEGWRLVAVSRFGMPIPSALVNYSFGVTNVRLWSFAWATLVFCIPQAVLFASLGAAGRGFLSSDAVSIDDLMLVLLAVASSGLAIGLVAARLRSPPAPSGTSHASFEI